MIQLCGKEILVLVQFFFKSVLEESIFPEEWKKGNAVPVHKKESKNVDKNYRAN